MIGCDDMVFPRINRLSYQIFLLSAIILIVSFFTPGGGFGAADIVLAVIGEGRVQFDSVWSTSMVDSGDFGNRGILVRGINFITTTMNARAKGVKIYDIPMLVWMIVIASILFMCSVGPLVAGYVMLLFDQTLGTPSMRRRR